VGKITCEILGEQRSLNFQKPPQNFSMASQLHQPAIPQSTKARVWNYDTILSLGVCFSKGNYYNVHWLISTQLFT